MQRLSIGKGHAFILVYSVTSRQSLEELRPIRDVIVEMKVTNHDDQNFSFGHRVIYKIVTGKCFLIDINARTFICK